MRLAGCVAAVVCVVVMQWGTGACGAAAVGDVASWGPDRVASWLIDGGFGAYAAIAQANNVRGIALHGPLRTPQGWKELGVHTVGHQVRLAEAVHALLTSVRLPRANVTDMAARRLFYATTRPLVFGRRGVPCGDVAGPPSAVEGMECVDRLTGFHDPTSNGLSFVHSMVHSNPKTGTMLAFSQPVYQPRVSHGLALDSWGSFFVTTCGKLQHDAHQLAMLESSGDLHGSVASAVGALTSITAGTRCASLDATTKFVLSPAEFAQVGKVHNRLLHLPVDRVPDGSTLLQPTVSALRVVTVTELRNQALYVENMLTQSVYMQLQQLCNQATVFWNAAAGFIEADMKNGFGSEALFHIAVELQQAMPAVLTRTELIDVVAFKPLSLSAVGHLNTPRSADLEDIVVTFWVETTAHVELHLAMSRNPVACSTLRACGNSAIISTVLTHRKPPRTLQPAPASDTQTPPLVAHHVHSQAADKATVSDAVPRQGFVLLDSSIDELQGEGTTAGGATDELQGEGTTAREAEGKVAEEEATTTAKDGGSMARTLDVCSQVSFVFRAR